MADASDSKSDVGDYVWVQVPSPAFFFYRKPYKGFLFFYLHSKSMGLSISVAAWNSCL